MAFSPKIYAHGEKPHHLMSQNSGSSAFNRYFYIRFGVVTEVDYDRYEIKVMWIHQDGSRGNIPVSFAYCGPAGCLGMLPEIGAIGMFGFYDEGGGKGSPILLTFLPSGLATGLDQNVVKIEPDAIPTSDVNEIQHRHRRLREGDMIAASPKGSGLFLNNSVELYDSAQDMIMIRDGDQAIIQTSLNNYVYADGASLVLGPAVRNGAVLYDMNGVRIADQNLNSITMTNGKEMIYAIPHGKTIGYDTQYFTEFRVDMDDYGNGKLDHNDINSNTLLSDRDPIVTFVMGNYVGANRKNVQQYGKVLRPVIFTKPGDPDGSFNLVQAVMNNGLDEPAALGLAYAMHFIKSGAFMGIDKEGHYYMNLPRSKANPLGAGRSMSTLGQGSLKEVWGADANDANSWDLTTKGGVKWDLGAHNNANNGTSLSITTTAGISINIGGEDDTGFAKTETVTGDVQENIGGTRTTTVNDNTLTINGLKTETVTGSASEIYQNDFSSNVMGMSSEVVVQEKMCKFGKRKTTITTGNDETEVLLGSVEETIKIGKRGTTVRTVAAPISSPTVAVETKVGAGNVETGILGGKFVVDIKAGSAEIKTKLGTIEISGTSIAIKATALVNVEAPLVKLGGGALVGGVVSGLPGNPNHFDFITGSPLKGSSKVSVG